MRAAKAFAAGQQLFVGPVTLKRPYNAYAIVADSDEVGALPESVDPRQASLLGAAWTLASGKHLSEQGANAVDILRDHRLARRDPRRSSSTYPDRVLRPRRRRVPALPHPGGPMFLARRRGARVLGRRPISLRRPRRQPGRTTRPSS